MVGVGSLEYTKVVTDEELLRIVERVGLKAVSSRRGGND